MSIKDRPQIGWYATRDLMYWVFYSGMPKSEDGYWPVFGPKRFATNGVEDLSHWEYFSLHVPAEFAERVTVEECRWESAAPVEPR